jgi:hypothetical protein
MGVCSLGPIIGKAVSSGVLWARVTSCNATPSSTKSRARVPLAICIFCSLRLRVRLLVPLLLVPFYGKALPALALPALALWRSACSERCGASLLSLLAMPTNFVAVDWLVSPPLWRSACSERCGASLLSLLAMPANFVAVDSYAHDDNTPPILVVAVRCGEPKNGRFCAG